MALRYFNIVCMSLQNSVSPLVKLQETCRNIGVGSPSRSKEQRAKRSPPRRVQNGFVHKPLKLTKERISKLSANSIERVDRILQSPDGSISKSPDGSMKTHPSYLSQPVTCSRPALVSLPYQTEHYTAASIQQQALYQKLLYQAELEKLKLPLFNSINSLVPPGNSYLADSQDLGLSPLNTLAYPTEFTKLAANFYYKLHRTPPASNNSLLTIPSTEALLNYRKLLLENNKPLSLSNFSSNILQPPKPPSHQCHWVTPDGYCGKKHFSFEDLMLHLKSHVDTPAEGRSSFQPSDPATMQNSYKLYKGLSDSSTNPVAVSCPYQSYSMFLTPKQLSASFLY